MLRLSLVQRALTVAGALLLCAACASPTVLPLGGGESTPQPASPLPTPNPNLAVYETPIRRDAKEQLLEDVVRLEFDIDDWQFLQDHMFGDVLVNRRVATCILLRPTGDPAEPDPRVERTLRLGKRTWTVHRDTWASDNHTWRLRYRSAPYEFRLLMLNYVEPVTDAAGRACIAATEALLSTFALAPAVRQPTTPDAVPAKPRLWLRANEDASGEPIVSEVDAAAESASWLRYASDRSGFSVAVPSGWSVNDDAYPAIYLMPPDGDRWQRIWITWLVTEKPDDRPLRSWVEAYAGDELMPRFATVGDDVLPIVDPSGTSKQARLDLGPIFVGDAYLISHGNLVLEVLTNSAWVDAPALLRAVASSIEFAEDAPMTLADIPWRFSAGAEPTATP